MIAKKKQVLTATLLIALIAAVAVNWYYSRSPVTVSDDNTSQHEEISGNLGDSLMVAGSVYSDENGNDMSEETTQQQVVDTAAQDAYFAEAKLKRSQMHDEVAEQIEEILSNGNLSQEGKSEVTNLLSDFQTSLKQETDTENLIKAKISGDCLVIISDKTAQVILPQGTLIDNVLLQITEIFENNTGISPENLTIIEAK